MRSLAKEWPEAIVRYLKPFRPEKIGLFGSYVRGDESQESDLDILIRLEKQIGLLEFVKIERELSELLGVKVDLVTEQSLKNETLRSYIEQDLMIIYQ